MSPSEKAWIDGASYSELMGKVRSEPPISEWFQGETGDYLFGKIRMHVERQTASDCALAREFSAAAAV